MHVPVASTGHQVRIIAPGGDVLRTIERSKLDGIIQLEWHPQGAVSRHGAAFSHHSDEVMFTWTMADALIRSFLSSRERPSSRSLLRLPIPAAASSPCRCGHAFGVQTQRSRFVA